jgi:hypothetical protein
MVELDHRPICWVAIIQGNLDQQNETNLSQSRDRLNKECEHGQSHVDDPVETGKLEKTE